LLLAGALAGKAGRLLMLLMSMMAPVRMYE
jgi:hypothetical protein